MFYLWKDVARCYMGVLFFLCCICYLYSKEPLAVVDDILDDQVKNLRNYEIINPVEFSSANLKNDSVKKKYFQISAFGSIHEIVIETLYESPHSDGVLIEYVGKNNSIQGKLFKDTGCIYNGPSGTNKSLNLVLNHCGGLEGFIQTEQETFFIEPLNNFSPIKPFHRKHIIYRSKDVIRPNFGQDSEEPEAVDAPPIRSYKNSTKHHRVKRSGFESFLTIINRSKRTLQLYYIDSFDREIPFIMLLVNERRGINTFEGTVWLARDDKTNKLFLINGKGKYKTTRNSHNRRAQLIVTLPTGTKFDNTEENNEVSGSQHYIEVLVVADASVVNFHGKGKVEKYLMTMMNIAGHVLKDKSLGVNINFEIVKVILLETDEPSFTVHTKNPTKTLVSACNYIAALKQNDEKHPDHFDIGIVMTRKDFGPSGYAQLYSMCSRKRSCALVQDEGLTSSFIAAHETAHLLGLDHDGEGESSDCKTAGPRGSVMAPLIVARYDRFHWSSCSRDVIRENLEYFDCLRNHPKQRIKNRNKQLPGTLYTLDEQCQFNFDKYSSKCTAFSFDPCRILWCRGESDRRCITMRGPALDGSVCARNKHCKKGECVEIDNHTRNEDKETLIVDGQWSLWTTWSSCSQSCGIGLRHRERFCNNPEPGPGGSDCHGDTNEMDICSTKDCRISKNIESLLEEQCLKLSGKGWTQYFDGDFNNRLKHPRINLNCTFEAGLCNWNDDRKKADIPWLLHKDATPSFQTGPNGDHTKQDGKGKYIYMEASSTNADVRLEGNVARLISPMVQVPRVCFGMFYHMWGEDMGSLKVDILFSNGTKFNQWNTTGNKGNRWWELQLSIESVENYQVIIEAARGAHWAGDVAIDDISIYAGVCPSDIQIANKCKISCRSRTAHSFNMNIDVTDGVECGDQRSNDICLKGKCVAFGCDNKFGSKLKFDDCGVCGGNGSLCVKRTGRKIVDIQKDYEVLVTLQKGSTFINVTELSPRAYFFGVRKKFTNGVYLSTKFEDYYNVEGTTFHFKKGKSGQQQIISKGPTNNDVEVVVYSHQHTRQNPVTLVYEYFEPSKGSRTYRYITDGWQSCSQSCGAGKQKSIVRCIREDDNEEVDETFCSHLQKPLRIRVCNLRPCVRNFIWTVRPWNRCSKTCAGGEQRRSILCIRKYDRAIAPDRYCRAARPPKIRVCNTHACPKRYVWKTREWNSCTATCGGGFKTRVVTCVEEGIELVSQENRCKQTKPDTLEPCAMEQCETFVWKVSEIGRCSVSCGGGLKLRIVNCVKESNRNVIVSNRYCDGPSPPRVLECNEHVCPEYIWDIGESSLCSVTCGLGVITRTVKCIDKVTRKVATNSNCKQSKPDETFKCNERQCIMYKIAYSEWGRCNAMCGIGVQRRLFYCLNKDKKTFVDAKYCHGKQILSTRACELNQCSKAENLNCDFESRDTCNWKTIKDDDFDWTVARMTPSLNTGPLSDHTKRNGYFAYIEASRPRREGDRSILASPYLRTEKGCLVFWYHMMGSTVGRLRLYLSSNATSKVVFEKKGHISRRWMLQKIELNSLTVAFAKSGYQFIFEGTVGNGAYGDIALDDIKLFNNTSCDQSNIVYNPIVQNCREISPLCRHYLRKDYCLQSSAYRLLCCKTCAEFMMKIKKI